MVESNQKHMKPSWATGQTVSIREESIIDNGSFFGGSIFPCTRFFPSVTFAMPLLALAVKSEIRTISTPVPPH